jgi:hypothetical protein
MRKRVLGFFGISFFFLVALVPATALGQAFVPVNDAELNNAFATYSTKFSTYASEMKSALTTAPDSLRDILAGPNPGGVAIQDCELDTYAGPTRLEPYTDPAGPWQRAIVYAQTNSSLGLEPLPSLIDPQVNDSGSIRCILQDLVGYQKISLFVQIQSMLKQYISDAQQKELSNQLLNQINSANLNWAKRGEQVTSGTTQSSESVYVQNTTASAENENERIADTIFAQTTAPDGDPVGSFGLNDPLYVATQVAANVRDNTENPRDAFMESIRPNITGAEVDAYMDNANTQTGSGAYFMLGDMFKNIQNTPLGASALVRSEAERRIAEETTRREKGEANTGFRPTKKCSGDPADPYCDPAFMVDVSPAGQNLETVVSAIQSGNQQIADSVALDTGAADAAASLSNEANTGDGGVAGYDTTALGASKTPVDALIYELYNTIHNAYFDLNPNQILWSQAALLMIYDEMEFNSAEPQTQIPSESGGAVEFTL